MKSCELCKCAAKIYCESDQASLCWTCDAKVHSANFLVARHLRSLLCRICQSPTAWSASGKKLGRTASVCQPCVEGCCGMKEYGGCEDREESQGGNDDEIHTERDDRIDVDDDDEEDGDNQVVPLSSTPPPPAASCSSDGESSSMCSNVNIDVSSKRLRANVADLSSDDDLGCSSAHGNNQAVTATVGAGRYSEDGEADSMNFKPLKKRKIGKPCG